ncbi:MAG: hypothetical protein ACRBDL_08965 [Alphaproteobacteria bacterium]
MNGHTFTGALKLDAAMRHQALFEDLSPKWDKSRKPSAPVRDQTGRLPFASVRGGQMTICTTRTQLAVNLNAGKTNSGTIVHLRKSEALL